MKTSIYNYVVKVGGVDLLYNTFTNRFIQITPEIQRSLEDDCSDVNLQNRLIQLGFLVPEDIDEKNIIDNLKMQRRFSTRVYQLIVNTSLDCNLKCWYCYETHLEKSYMSLDLAQKILRHIELKYQTDKFETLELSFFGGEPMLNFKVISTLLEGVKIISTKKQFKVNLTFVTNGTCISQRYIELLKDFQVRFQITIDGNKSVHNSVRKYKSNKTSKNSYDTIIESLRLLNDSKNDFYYTLRVNYDERVLRNIHSLIFDLDFMDRKRTTISLHKIWQCNEDKIDSKSLFEIIEAFNQKRFYVNIFRLLTKFDCCYADNYNQAVINYDGKVFKCTARDFVKERNYGMLNSLGIIEWHTNLLAQRLSLQTPSKCHSCGLYPSCSGICSQKLEEANDGNELKCPFEKNVSKDDIILLNVKQRLILNGYEKI